MKHFGNKNDCLGDRSASMICTGPSWLKLGALVPDGNLLVVSDFIKSGNITFNICVICMILQMGESVH